MNQIPIQPVVNPYVMQQPPACLPNYNAVKIEINNPTVGTGLPGSMCSTGYSQPTMPYYTYPQYPIYNYPQAPATYPDSVGVQNIPAMMPPYYVPTTPLPAQPTVPNTVPNAVPSAVQPAVQPQEVPPVQPVQPVQPAQPVQPVIVSPAVQQQNINTPQPVPVLVTNPLPLPVDVVKTVPPSPVISVEPAVEKPAQPSNEIKPEVVPPTEVVPEVDLNEFISKLTNPDFDVQAAAMEDIASLIKKSPDKATELIDTKVFDALNNIINFDSSKLEGPSPEQNAAREKIINNKEVTDEERVLANTISAPSEQAERNKIYALYATAMMQKLFADEVSKLSNAPVPLPELPGLSTVVEQLKNNPNPMVRASAIEALSYIQNPEYKKDLMTVFNVAKNDVDPDVAQAAQNAIDNLAKV